MAQSFVRHRLRAAVPGATTQHNLRSRPMLSQESFLHGNLFTDALGQLFASQAPGSCFSTLLKHTHRPASSRVEEGERIGEATGKREISNYKKRHIHRQRQP